MLENTKLVSLLDDPSLLAKKAYVAGEWVSAKDGKTFDVVRPLANPDKVGGNRRKTKPSPPSYHAAR